MSDFDRTKAGEQAGRTQDRGLSDLGEDTTGFGRAEVRTIWHSLIRPAVVVQAYMTQGPTGGGLYSRPLRLYLGLCGFLMLVLFLQGGNTDAMLLQMPPDVLSVLVEQSGKSRDTFMADADGWITLVTVPLLSLFYALFTAPLIRLWDPENLGWRRGFRATFAYLNAWTVPVLPLSFFAYRGDLVLPTAFVIVGLSIVAFLRAGKGRWYRTRVGGVFKALALAVVLQIAGMVGGIPVGIVGILGGLYGA